MHLKSNDRFYFYHSILGDLSEIILRHVRKDLQPAAGYLTNAFGIKIDPKHFPSIEISMGVVEPPPIPSNWHADIAEFGSALRAVELAHETFTIIELGCGWGTWLNICGIVAKSMKKKIRLIGVEGDKEHIRFAKEALRTNGFFHDEFEIHHGIIASKAGMGLFPKQKLGGENWGLEALLDVSKCEKDKMLKSDNYFELKLLSLESLISDRASSVVDILHVDIQGSELTLLSDSIRLLSNTVRTCLIGTHSRQIEGGLLDLFLRAGWVLEVERPAVIEVGINVKTLVDGVQFWRNKHICPDPIDNALILQRNEDFHG